MDPFATTFGVAAGMVDLQDHMTEKQQGDVAALITLSVMQSLTNKTWLSGIGDLINAIDDPKRYGGNWLERMAGSAAVPTGVAQVARTIDPTLRDAEGVLDAVKARIPGMTQSVEPRRDVWGQPLVGEGGIGPDIVSPAWESTRKNDPVNNALIDAGVRISKPQRKDMTAAEYGQLRELSGSIGKAAVADLIKSPEWKALNDDDRQDAVDKIMKDARKEAKAALAGGGGAVPGSAADDPWAAFPDAPK